MPEMTTEIRIVVAEDEHLIRSNLVNKIEKLDPVLKVVHTAADGRDALAYIEQSPVDLLVTDIRMPIMDGLELIKAVHLQHPHVRKILTTGYADFEYARQAVRYGASDYLLKPIKAAELKQALVKARTSIESSNRRIKADAGSLGGPPGVKPEEIVQLVQHYLRENFACDITMEDISRQFNFSSAYLSKLFLKYTGEPPTKYLISLRINEAKYLLASHPRMSVKEAGERVGYPDQFYFSRLFKQVAGQTPSEYQKGLKT